MRHCDKCGKIADCYPEEEYCLCVYTDLIQRIREKLGLSVDQDILAELDRRNKYLYDSEAAACRLRLENKALREGR